MFDIASPSCAARAVPINLQKGRSKIGHPSAAAVLSACKPTYLTYMSLVPARGFEDGLKGAPPSLLK
jgi:hypothetical protein